MMRDQLVKRLFPDAPPDHSTISRTRRLIDVEHIGTCLRGCWSDSSKPFVKGKTITIEPHRPRWGVDGQLVSTARAESVSFDSTGA
jgi:hypothetical protein